MKVASDPTGFVRLFYFTKYGFKKFNYHRRGSCISERIKTFIKKAMSGWIKLHRSLLEWEWYDDANATRLLIHLLISVNYEKKVWHGITINPGTLITSFEKLSEATGLTPKQVRIAMDKLKSSGEVAGKRADKGQAITLVKWEKLQSDEEKRASNRADRGQTEGRPRATTKEGKKERIKESIIDKSIIEGGGQIEKINLSPFEEGFRPEWEKWIQYKKDEHKQTYKRIETQQSAFKLLLELSKNNSDIAKKIIDQSISNQWKGLFALKQNSQNGTGKKSTDDAIREFLGG